MVSKYRDILDPDMLQKMTIGSMSSDELEKRLESIEKGTGTKAEENYLEDKNGSKSLPSDPPLSGAGGDGEQSESDKKPSENNVDEVESLRQMLAGLTGTKYEKVENIGDRKMNQISSVGAAFGSFSHELVTKKLSTSPNQEMANATQVANTNVPEPEHLDEPDDSSNSPTPPLPISDQLDQSDLPQLERIDSIMQRSVDDVAERLDKCLGNVNPLLRDVLYDFQTYLTKTLLGSHGQTLVPGGLNSISSGSADGSSTVSLVMLLCSQEWQNSIQKNAGLAFIELINEGRLFSSAMKDHAVRVGNEAEFILNRARADDVKRQADAEMQHAQLIGATKREESACATLISAARRRDALQGSATARRALQALTNPSGCWHRAETDKVYWRLDAWEDDTRRRRRMVKNPWGSDHAEAINSANHSIKEKIEKIELPPGVTPVTMPNVRSDQIDTDQSNSSINDEDDISDNETGSQMINSPTVTFSCDAALIAPGVAINGTLSIHQEEIYWEADDSGMVIKIQCYWSDSISSPSDLTKNIGY